MRNFVCITVYLGSLLLSHDAAAITLALDDDFEDANATESSWLFLQIESEGSVPAWSVQSGTLQITDNGGKTLGVIGKDGPCAIRSGIGAGHTAFRNTTLSVSFDMRHVDGSARGGVYLLLTPAPDFALIGFHLNPVFNIIWMGFATQSTNDELDSRWLGDSFDPTQWHHYDVGLSNNVVTVVVDNVYTLSAAVPTSLPNGSEWGLLGGTGLQVGPDGNLDTSEIPTPYPSSTVQFDNYVLNGDAECPSIDALIDIAPDTLNRKSRARYITVYITLPEGFALEDIDLSSIQISAVNGVTCSSDYVQLADLTIAPSIGDYDGDSVPDLALKFDRQTLVANLCNDDLSITIEGDLVDGDHFIGQDSIRVIERGR